jgi:hypothetical protein
MGWMKHVACMRVMTYAYKILVRKLEGRDHFKVLGRILKWISRK